MKRAGHLLSRIAEHTNLMSAFWKAARGRRNLDTVRRFALDLDEQCGALGREILEGSVGVGEFNRFIVFDPKRRTIHASPFRERVLHHAIMNVCSPHFERGAIDGSCACRIGKGNRAAVLQAQRFAARNRYFLKMDIRRYFDSIDGDLRDEYDRMSSRAYAARRVVRGGSYWNNARNCRSAYRNANEPGNRDRNLGFRLASAHPTIDVAADPALVAQGDKPARNSVSGWK